MFHSSCIMKWALKTACETGCVECQQPTKNRQIYLFKQGENIFTCPCCRIEYTTVPITYEIKRVLAKVHVEDKGKCLIHYITKETDTIAYVPLSEILSDKMSGKCATILPVMQCAWERGERILSEPPPGSAVWPHLSAQAISPVERDARFSASSLAIG